MDDLQMIVDAVQGVGMWVIGFALFWNERKSHEETRRNHNNDLREIAGMSPRLQRHDIGDKSQVEKL